jgi:hypothetical protein
MRTRFPVDLQLGEWDSPLGELVKRCCIDDNPLKADIPWLATLMDIWELPEADLQ